MWPYNIWFVIATISGLLRAAPKALLLHELLLYCLNKNVNASGLSDCCWWPTPLPRGLLNRENRTKRESLVLLYCNKCQDGFRDSCLLSMCIFYLRSIVLRYTCAPPRQSRAVRYQLPCPLLFCLFCVFWELSLFPSIFYHSLSFLLCMSALYIFLSGGVFLPCDHGGLDFDIK